MEKGDAVFTLITNSNHFLNEIDHEIQIIHKGLWDVYLLKFKELETIVYDPVKYAHCVVAIGNEVDM